MPAILRCPEGCKLQVPVRKLFEPFQCPKCQAALLVAKEEIDRFQADRKYVLKANRSDDLVENESEGVVFVGGEPNESLEPVTASSTGTAAPKTISEMDLLDPSPVPESAAPVVPPIQFVEPQAEKPPVQSVATPAVPEPPPPPVMIPANASAPAPTVLPPATVKAPVKSREADGQKVKSTSSTANAEEPEKGTRSTGFLRRWLHDDSNPGVLHGTETRWKAYSLAWAMVVVALFLFSPVIVTMLGWIGKDFHAPLGRWAFFLIFFSAIQLLYALFLWQVPDWTTTRFVSYFQLGMTVFSTFLVSVALLSGVGNGFYEFLQLSVTTKSKVCGWLLVMSIGFGMMSYLCGLTTQGWMRDESRRLVAR